MALAAVAAASVAAGGCGPKGSEGPAIDELDRALRPAALTAALKKLGGAHWVGSAMFAINPAPAAQGGSTGTPQAATTTTELWTDKENQFQLLERNDHDGGREVVRYGKELAVALRHGKMIRRPVQEPEPTRYLEEALGAPWAAWETVRRFAAVERAKDNPGIYKVTRGDGPVAVPASFGEATPLRRWRDTIQVQSLEGEVRLEPNGGALLSFALRSRFTAVREDKVQLAGEVAVTGRLDRIGTTTPIPPVVDAEELKPRQRTILEERALLGGITRSSRPAAKESR